MRSTAADALCLVAWLAAAALLFRANLHTDDDGILAGLLLLFAAAVSFLSQRLGRIAGSLLGLSIVSSEAWNFHVNGPRPSMSSFLNFLVLAAFLTAIAAAGAFLGYGAGVLSRRAGIGQKL